MIRVLEVNVDDHLYGGVFVLVRSIIKNMPNDFKVDIAALEPFDEKKHIDEFNECGSEVYYVGSRRNKIWKQFDIFKNVKKLVDMNQYDVVHLHSDVSHKILVSALAARNAKKLVFHAHACDTEGGFRHLRIIFHRICCLFLKRIPAAYVATSCDAARWMFPWADDKRVQILDNGVDYQKFIFNQKVRDAKRNELKIKEDTFLVGFFGRFVFPKNPLFVLKVFKLLLEKNNNAKLLCIGEGPLKEEFIEGINKYNITAQSIIMGNTDYIEEYYQALDALIMPSNYEGFGLVAVESQISGTPTLVSNKVPQMTEISRLIHYLPIDSGAESTWVEELERAKSYVKHNIYEELDEKYEIKKLVNKIITIYSN